MALLDEHLAALNAGQKPAAMHREGRALVNAGAGTGKTKTLVARYLALLLDEDNPTPASDILCITYTNAGAQEMSNRITAELLALGLPELARSMPQAWISTIHGFCSRLLRRYSLEAGIDPYFVPSDELATKMLQLEAFGELVATDSDEFQELRQVWENDATIAKHTLKLYERLRTAGLRQFDRYYRYGWQDGKPLMLSQDWGHRLVLDDLGWVEEGSVGLSLLTFVRDFSLIYQRLCFERSTIDFNDQLLIARDLLAREDVLTELQSQFKFTMIDEAQDTNALQLGIISAIAGENLFLVGDTKQSIYGFQGANVQVMANYAREIDSSEGAFELSENYRSAPGVLAFANALFGNDELLGHAAIELDARKTSPDGSPLEGGLKAWPPRGVKMLELAAAEGEKPKAALVGTQEAIWVADQIEQLMVEGRDKGLSYSDCSVLVQKRRHGNALLAEFEKRGIPAILLGGDSLLTTPIVKHALLLLKLMCRPRDPELLLKALMSPMAGISDQGLYDLGRIRREMKSDYLWDAALAASELSSLSHDDDQQRLDKLLAVVQKGRARLSCDLLSEVIGEGFCALDMDLHYLAQGALKGRQALVNLRSFLSLADDWQARGKDALSFADDLERQSALGLKVQEEAVSLEGEDCVTISTIHSSKGLEYKVVILPFAQSLEQRFNREQLMFKSFMQDMKREADHSLAPADAAGAAADTAEGGLGDAVDVAAAVMEQFAASDDAGDLSAYREEGVVGVFDDYPAGDCILVRRRNGNKPEYVSPAYEQVYQWLKEDEHREAMRLLYVACTRAEDLLIMSYSDAEGDSISDAVKRGMDAASRLMSNLEMQGDLSIERQSMVHREDELVGESVDVSTNELGEHAHE
ncbi:MAG: UvrD-helicase domain-containing protein [Coriobacteriia bacterium]|nr:UvrD-helicase domain-containing protein [Coriobacteriia bacterium]MCL2537134.1 UvrD-helicase domain-containing protein [Coriobacteriia bacterium]